MGIFKKFAYGAVSVCVLGAVIAGCGGSDTGDVSSSSTTKQEQQKVYADADINVLIKESEDNAAAANKNYKGKAVRIIGGTVSNIESDADYINIKGDNSLSLVGIQCHTKGNKELKEAVMNLKNNQRVVIYGTVTKCGEIVGYSLDLDKVEPAQ